MEISQLVLQNKIYKINTTNEANNEQLFNSIKANFYLNYNFDARRVAKENTIKIRNFERFHFFKGFAESFSRYFPFFNFVFFSSHSLHLFLCCEVWKLCSFHLHINVFIAPFGAHSCKPLSGLCSFACSREHEKAKSFCSLMMKLFHLNGVEWWLRHVIKLQSSLKSATL